MRQQTRNKWSESSVWIRDSINYIQNVSSVAESFEVVGLIHSIEDEIYDFSGLSSFQFFPFSSHFIDFFARLNNGKNNWFCLFILVRWMSKIQSNKKYKKLFFVAFCIQLTGFVTARMRWAGARKQENKKARKLRARRERYFLICLDKN